MREALGEKKKLKCKLFKGRRHFDVFICISQ